MQADLCLSQCHMHRLPIHELPAICILENKHISEKKYVRENTLYFSLFTGSVIACSLCVEHSFAEKKGSVNSFCRKKESVNSYCRKKGTVNSIC